MPKRIGVLALQGDFEAHQRALARAGAEGVPVRTAAELDAVNGLIIPGGESTTMLKLAREEGLLEPLRRFGEARPVFGTCAGAILLASEVLNPAQESLGLLDLTVERNAYGRQVDSRVVHLKPEREFGPGEVEAVFIRAPVIRRVGPDATVYLRYNGDPVLVGQGRHLAATFHPELTSDDRIHKLFLRRLESPARRYRVLFVCIGNACRSQIAEAFARRDAPDIIEPASCGTTPAQMVAPVTCELMREKGIDMTSYGPKGFAEVGADYDLVINMSGGPLPVRFKAPVIQWNIADPYWLDDEQHREIRDEIAARVRALAQELREK